MTGEETEGESSWERKLRTREKAVRDARKEVEEGRRERRRTFQEKLQRSLARVVGPEWLGETERLDLAKRERAGKAEWERGVERRLLEAILDDDLRALPRERLPFRPSTLDTLREEAASRVGRPATTTSKKKPLIMPTKGFKPVRVSIAHDKIPWWKGKDPRPIFDPGTSGNRDERRTSEGERRKLEWKHRSLRGTIGGTTRRGRERAECHVPNTVEGLSAGENEARALQYFEAFLTVERDLSRLVEPRSEDEEPPKRMDDLPGMVSVATVIKGNLAQAGLTEELHRVVFVFSFNDDYEGSLPEAFAFFTDRLNRRPLGEPVTGLLLYYDRIAVNMIEAGELQIMAYLRELAEPDSFLRLRMGECRVFATHQHCGPRLFPGGHFSLTTEAPPHPAESLFHEAANVDWDDLGESDEEEEEGEEDEAGDDPIEKDQEFKRIKRKMAVVGNKLMFLWTYLNIKLKDEEELPEDRSLTFPTWMTSELPATHELEFCLKCPLFATLDEYVNGLYKVADVEEVFEADLPPGPSMIPFNVMRPCPGEDEAGRNIDPGKVLDKAEEPDFTPYGYPVLNDYL